MIGNRIGMKEFPNPILFPTLGFCLGIILQAYWHLPFLAPIVIMLLTITLVTKLKFVPLLLLIIALGAMRYDATNPKNPLEEYLSHEETTNEYIKGHVTDKDHLQSGDWVYIVRTESTYSFPFQVTLRVFSENDTLMIGDIISAYINLNRVDPALNPGEFDYSGYMLRNGIHGKANFSSKIKVFRNRQNLRTVLNRIKLSALGRIERVFPNNSGFVKAVLFGDRSELNEVRDTFKDAGVMHLLAISGLHIGIIYLFVFTSLRFFLSKRASIAIACIILLGYLAVCNNSPSVSRAVIMITIISLAKILERDISIIQLLSLSALLILFLNPHELFNVGFQLSFTAVYTILVITPKLGFINHHKENRYIKYLLTPIVITVSVNLLLLPIILYHFHEAPLVGVISSIPAILLFSLYFPITILVYITPVSALSQFLYPVSEQLLHLLFKLVYMTSNLLLKLDYIIFPRFLIIAFWIFIVIIPLLKHRRIVMLCFIILFSATLFYVNEFGSKRFEVVSFAVGHGDCHLIRNGNGVVMIDTGAFNKRVSEIERHVFPYLKENGIKSIDKLIITHQHNDHYGGILPLLNEVKVKELVVSSNFARSGLFKHWKSISSPIENTVVTVVDDTLHYKKGNMDLLFINPVSNYMEYSVNNQSLITKLEYKQLSILFTGDLEIEGENEVLRKYKKRLKSDVLKAGHHGAKNTIGYSFLKTVSPYLVIIPANCKKHSDFAKETLIKLKEFEIEYYITGYDGAVIITEESDRFFARTYHTHETVYLSY